MPIEISLNVTDDEMFVIEADRVEPNMHGAVEGSSGWTFPLHPEQALVYETYTAIEVEPEGDYDYEVRLPNKSILSLADAIRRR